VLRTDAVHAISPSSFTFCGSALWNARTSPSTSPSPKLISTVSTADPDCARTQSTCPAATQAHGSGAQAPLTRSVIDRR
jgi:hypothetical protein